jgi:hypothetical protein
VNETTRLTDADRRMIAKAAEVAALKDPAAMRERYGDANHVMARAAAFGEAQFLLLELDAIIARLDGHGGTITATAQIADGPHLAGAGTIIERLDGDG